MSKHTREDGKQTKSEKLAADRVAKAANMASLSFTTSPRPVNGSSTVLTPLHHAVLATLENKQAVSVPIPEGMKSEQVVRQIRTPLVRGNHITNGNRFRKVVSVDNIKCWVEPRPAPREKKEKKGDKKVKAAA